MFGIMCGLSTHFLITAFILPGIFTSTQNIIQTTSKPTPEITFNIQPDFSTQTSSRLSKRSSTEICGYGMTTANELLKCSGLCRIGYDDETGKLVLPKNWDDYDETESNFFMSQEACVHKNIAPEEILKYGQLEKRNPVWVELSDILVTEIDDRLGQVTLNLEVTLEWDEHRLLVFSNESVKIDPQLIWTPNFQLETELVSKSKIEEDKVTAVNNYEKMYNAKCIGGTECNLEARNENFQIPTARMKKLSYIRTTFVCDMEFYSFPFEEHICKLELLDPAFKTIVESVDCCQLPKIGKRFNGYQIDSFEGFHSRESDATSKFGVSINFSRTNTNKFLLQYHLVCCPLVVAASISFLMEPITFPGRIGIIQTYLVTIILTITSFFASGQNESSYFTALSEYLITCMIFVLFAMMYFGVMALIVNIKLAKIVKRKKLHVAQDQANPQLPDLTDTEVKEVTKRLFVKDNEHFQQDLYMSWDHRIFLTYNLVFSIYNVFYFTNHLS